MRLGRLLIVVSIVLILGLVALYAVFQLNAAPPQDGAPQTTDIVFVTQSIPRGGLITADAIGYRPFPADLTTASMILNTSEAIGRLARYDLEPDQPLLTSMVVGSASEVSSGGSDTSLLIPPGMVAFPVPINRFSSLAYGLRAGDHINVIATLLLVDVDSNFQSQLPNNTAGVLAPGEAVVSGSETADQASSQLIVDPLLNVLTAQIVNGGATSPQGQGIFDEALGQPFYVVPSEAQRPRLVSQTLLQNVVVLHVGNFLFTDENGEEVQNVYGTTVTSDTGETTVLKSPPDLITLIVTPQDAITLNYLVYAGAKLTLALRSANDDSIATTEAVTLEYLLTTYNIPVPTKLPYGLEPRIDSLQSPTQQDVLPQPPQ
ncbi:MAG: SAF domain-containing protein [Anaerolineales bacterium]